jgi:protein-S-isoprenylcysteine O-methyltransferase Ste14
VTPRRSLALGALANLALLTLPLVVFSATDRLAQPGVLVVLGMSTLSVVSEASAVHTSPAVSDARDDILARGLAGATGLLLWLTLAVAILGVGSMGGSPAVAVPLALIGGTAMLGGAWLRRASIRALGRHFRTEVTVPSDQALITDGVFARRRHPSELGLLLLAVGGAIATGSLVAGALVVAVLAPLVAVRIRLEESALVAAFPMRYPRYARRTPALLGRAR